eukprot:g8703.t1
MNTVMTQISSGRVDIFISTQFGNDINNSSNDGAFEHPYKTIRYVQKRLRKLRQENNFTTQDSIYVNFLEGQYVVKDGIQFNDKFDSGISKTIYQAYNENHTVNISTGYEIPEDSFSLVYKNVYECDLKKLKGLHLIDFKTLRMGDHLISNARYPNGGWFYVDKNVNVYKGNNTFLLGVRNNLLPTSIKKSKLKNAKIHMFPTLSWINFEASIVEQSNDPLCPSNYKCFLVYSKHCTNTSLSCHIRPGNRFYIYSFQEALSNNEWYLNYKMKKLYISKVGGKPSNVYIPQNDFIFHFQNVNNYKLKNLNFIDVDYTANGFQEGFNILPTSYGMPSDSSIHISYSKEITIVNCLFHQLGSGGIHVTNQSSAIYITANRFYKIGQSPIMFTGNTTYQANNCLIANNTIKGVGEILASAGGVLISSGSYLNVTRNNISNCSRWGIAIRSNSGIHGLSIHNIVELNHLENMGTKTRDFGGLSFIGDGITHSIVRNNCVKNVIGYDTDLNGTILTPFFNWGIYLDNDASGFIVEGNVVNTNVNGGIFFHGGKNNIVQNNIFVNCSNNFPKKGHYGFYNAGQSDVGTFGNHVAFNNTYFNNIIWYTNNRSKLISGKSPFNSTLYKYKSDYNIFYSPRFQIDAVKDVDLTPVGVGNWKAWVNAGYDLHSKLNVDPMFMNPYLNDFRLDINSPAFKLGWKKIPDAISSNC